MKRRSLIALAVAALAAPRGVVSMLPADGTPINHAKKFTTSGTFVVPPGESAFQVVAYGGGGNGGVDEPYLAFVHPEPRIVLMNELIAAGLLKRAMPGDPVPESACDEDEDWA